MNDMKIGEITHKTYSFRREKWGMEFFFNLRKSLPIHYFRIIPSREFMFRGKKHVHVKDWRKKDLLKPQISEIKLLTP